MTETIRFRKIYVEDLRTGLGTEEVTLADGSIVSLTKINLGEFTYTDSNGTMLHGFGDVGPS